MIKVAIYVPSMSGGGAERVMMILANNFVARGMSVDLVLVNSAGPFLASVDSRVRIVNLGCSGVLKSMPALVRYYRMNKPSVILSALDYANVVSLLAKTFAQLPSRHIVSVHTSIRSTMCCPNSSPVNRAVFWLMRLTYPSADGVVAVSEGVKEDIVNLVGVPSDRVYRIYNPVVGDDLNERAQEPLDHPWFAAGEIPVVISAGRMTEVKDFGLLIRAFCKVVKRCECRLVILGDGEKREELECLIDALGLKSRVLLPGFQQNPFKWMSRASLFVLSSRLEGLSNVLIEALACGVPVVSTDCASGPNEILQNGRWGRLVPVGDDNAMADAIVDLLGNTGKANPGARAAYFNTERAVNAYLDVLLPTGRSNRGVLDPIIKN